MNNQFSRAYNVIRVAVPYHCS